MMYLDDYKNNNPGDLCCICMFTKIRAYFPFALEGYNVIGALTHRQWLTGHSFSHHWGGGRLGG